jgi:hypothetical protein
MGGDFVGASDLFGCSTLQGSDRLTPNPSLWVCDVITDSASQSIAERAYISNLVSSLPPCTSESKQGWTHVGATADEVCRPECPLVSNSELASRGGTNRDPVCRCKAGFYLSAYPEGSTL